MARDTLGRFLAGEFRDPDDGKPLVAPIRTVVIEDSLAGREAELVGALELGGRLAVVCDPTTRAVLGWRVEQALGRIADVQSIVLPGMPHPDDQTVALAAQGDREAERPDRGRFGHDQRSLQICERARGKPYAVFATAPSMNGYTSLNAAITEHGHKKRSPAQAPVGAFFDLACWRRRRPA